MGYRPWAELGLDGDQTFLGFALARGERFTFDRGAIYVDLAQPSEMRRVILRHEVLHAVGFMFHPYSHPRSALHIGRAHAADYPRVFSTVDNALIRILYDPRVEGGMTLEEVEGLGF